MVSLGMTRFLSDSSQPICSSLIPIPLHCAGYVLLYTDALDATVDGVFSGAFVLCTKCDCVLGLPLPGPAYLLVLEARCLRAHA